MNLTPYIIFNGKCEEALKFYSEVFGGEVKSLMRFEGTPGEEMAKDKNQIMHATFEAPGMLFMASDSGEVGLPSPTAGMVHLSINFDDRGKQENVFNTLSEGGEVTMPLNVTFWGARFGMVTDRYGLKWMLSTEHK